MRKEFGPGLRMIYANEGGNEVGKLSPKGVLIEIDTPQKGKK